MLEVLWRRHRLKFVDTTFIICLLRGDRRTIEKARELNGEGGAATTTVNVYEAAYGVHRSLKDNSRRLAELEKLMQNLDVFGLTYEAALKAAELSGDLGRRGLSLDPFDSMVAAIAIVNGADSLVTRNTRHFAKVKGLITETH